MRLRIRSKLILSYCLVALIPLVGILVMPMVNEPLVRETTANRLEQASSAFYDFIDHKGGICQELAEEIIADATLIQMLDERHETEARSYVRDRYTHSVYALSLYQEFQEEAYNELTPYVPGRQKLERLVSEDIKRRQRLTTKLYSAHGKAALRENQRFRAGVAVYYPIVAEYVFELLEESDPDRAPNFVTLTIPDGVKKELRRYSSVWEDLVYTGVISPSAEYDLVLANDPEAATAIYMHHKPRLVYTSPMPATRESTEEVKQNWLAAYMPLVTVNDEFIAIFRAGQPLTGLRLFYQQTALYLVGISALGALVALGTGAWFARSISRRIWLLARGARRVSEGNLDFEIVDDEPDELGDLAHIFNIMTRRLQSNLTELRQRADVIEDKNRLLDQTVRELTHVRDFTENVLSQVGSGVFTVDPAGRITQINPACRQLFAPDADADSLLGNPLQRLLPEGPLRDRLLEMIPAPTLVSHWETTEIVEGHKLPLEVSIAPMETDAIHQGMVVTVRDLSIIRGLEESVRRSEKLAALGHLSAGMAHEIRNPLGIIKGSAELLERKFADSEDARDLARYIIDESVRLSRTLQDFLDFARPREPSLDSTSINQVIHRTVPLADHHPLRDRVSLVVDLAQSLPDLQVDAAQCQQVFLNLLLNAFEASRDGGTVSIRSRLDGEADEVVVSIEDEGAGISGEQMANIFNPFFTTKNNGTGLGLSIVHRILESHHASVEVTSREGEGTVFTLRFPAGRVPTGAPGKGA